MGKLARFALGCGLALAMALGVAPAAMAEGWTVALTKKQAKALGEISGKSSHVAFAISPDGSWGRSWGKPSAAIARESALSFCRAYLSRGKRDCLIYMVNGKRVAPAVVNTRPVAEVYKPLNGRRAASVFGRSDFNFTGNLAAARAQLAAGMADPGALRQDDGLRAKLAGRTLMNTSSKGWAVWLGKQRAAHLAQANSGVLTTEYESWRVTSDGLLCMRGASVKTRCILLGPAKAGALKIYWSFTPKAGRKAQLIAGDARGGAVRY